MNSSELIIKNDKEALQEALGIPESNIVYMGGRKYACVTEIKETIIVNHPRSKLPLIKLIKKLNAEAEEATKDIKAFDTLEDASTWDYYEGVLYAVGEIEKLLKE